MTNKEYDKAIYEVVKDFELKKRLSGLNM